MLLSVRGRPVGAATVATGRPEGAATGMWGDEHFDQVTKGFVFAGECVVAGVRIFGDQKYLIGVKKDEFRIVVCIPLSFDPVPVVEILCVFGGVRTDGNIFGLPVN